MRIPLIAATVLSCACANTAHNLPPIQAAPTQTSPAPSKSANQKTGSLKSFKSERALKSAFSDVGRLREAYLQQELERRRQQCLDATKDLPIPFDCSNGLAYETVTVAGAVGCTSEDTNRQHEGLDEGGLVKKVGDLLVVLRRGRVFTIDTSGAQLAMVDMTDLAAKDPQSRSAHDWYDELLIADRTVIVIGYSNSRGGTEVVLFNLHEGGRLELRGTYILRSDDYYSGENYASRLVGDKLILYTTRGLPEQLDNLDWLPAMRRWEPTGTTTRFEPIVSGDRVFRKNGPLSAFPTVHTIVTCEVSVVAFTCSGSVLLADHLSAYYASPAAGYAWTQDWSEYPKRAPRSVVYRFAFDGSPILALQVEGNPSNQLAFLESDDAHLNVVVHRNEARDVYVASLLRVPLSAFADGSVAASADSYRDLATDFDWLASRFIGEFVVVGEAAWASTDKRLIVARWRSPQMFTLPVQHRVERIESMGEDAIVIGSNGQDLEMTAISLTRNPASVATLSVEGTRQSESTTHGFLYRAESAREGLFGLPLLTSSPSDVESAWVMFVRNRHLSLESAGRLDAFGTVEEDNCVVSCVDWYGNARAIFSRARVFAVMGYEVIEGRIGSDGQISETQRLNFNPGTKTSH